MHQRATRSLLVALDSGSRLGLQQQIYQGVRRAILDGVLPPGARLPSSRTLARELDVSRTTTLLAFEQLLAEGYLTARRGTGTFVARELPDDLPKTRPPRPGSSVSRGAPSLRSRAIATAGSTAERLAGPPRPFRLGVPALDLFPVQLWSRLMGRRLRGATLSDLDYCGAGGLRALREAIAHYVSAARGTRCQADQIQVVTSAQAATALVCSLLLEPGDTAWMEEPGYPGARSALLAAGARIVPVPVDEDGLDVRAGIERARDARLAHVVPSHQFPLGVRMSLPRRLALLGWASAARAWIVEDDYDSEFRHGERAVPCLHGLDADERVIYVGSFSKILFPALRVGFLIAPPELREPMLAVRRALDMSPSTPIQAALAEFMVAGHLERHVRRMRMAYRERLEALASEARRLCAGALRLRPTRTGLHAIADLEGVTDVRVFREAAARGVEVMPLSHYYLDRERAANGLVLGFGSVRPDALRSGMERLAEAIEAARSPAPCSPAPRTVV